MVDRDPVGRPGRPASLSARTDPAVSEAGSVEEPTKIRRTVRAVEVADDQGRASVLPEPVGQDLELATGRKLPGTLQRRDEMDEPEMSGFSIKINDGVNPGHPPRGHRRDQLDRNRPGSKPERQPRSVVIVGKLPAVRKERADRFQSGQPGMGDLDQTEDVGAFATDQADQGIAVLVVDQQVRRENPEAGRRSRVEADRVRSPAVGESPGLPESEQGQDDRHRSADRGHRQSGQDAQGQGRLAKVGQKVEPGVESGEDRGDWMNPGRDRQGPGQPPRQGSAGEDLESSAGHRTNPIIAALMARATGDR